MQDLKSISMPDNAVAVIGAGPAGLVSARWLKQHGFEPILFEAADRLGDQWNSASSMSGTWSGMPTNTSRILTAFADLDHAPETAVYPRQDQMLAYLERYAGTFDLTQRIRLRTRVEQLDRAGDGGWLIRSTCGGAARAEIFQRALVATGRYVAPSVPNIAGLETFSGSLGVAHTSQYDGAARYRDKDVLVAGCSISALEIASDLALGGARSVTAAYRRQRYILPKLIAGVPTDHVMFTRAAALAGEVVPPDILAEGLKATVLRAAGSPEQFGARAPDDNIFAAGIAQSQHFLAAVAEGRIATRPWIDGIDGRLIRFADGTSRAVDALLFGTGYRLSLPWLAPSVAAVLGLDGEHIDLHEHTFHPDLPGLAFVGLYDQVGPLLPVLELQARWIAYAFAGLVPAPTRATMVDGVARSQAGRNGPQSVPMHAMAVLFARNAGVEPELDRWPELERALLFGPLAPISFRLQGPDSLADAACRTAAAAAAFGAIGTSDFTPEECGLREMIRVARPAAAA